jgi:hypothetical protein
MTEPELDHNPAWRRRLAEHRYGIGVYAACQLVLLAWWLAFFPVLVSPDSITYVVEATTNHWATDHSVVYDALIWLSLEATHGVAVLTFLQIAVTAILLAYIATGLRRLGARPWFAAIVPVVALLTPALGSFPVYLWKDVPFALGGLWLVGLLLRLVEQAETGSGWAANRRTRRLLLWVFVATLASCLARNNAFVFVVIAVVLVLILWRRAALRLAGSLLLGAVAATVLTVAVFPALGVSRAKSDLVLGPAYDDIAYVYQRDPHALSEHDQQLLSAVAPLPVWRHAGNCYTSDDLTNDPKFSKTAASAHGSQLFALWRRLLVDHPLALTRARLCRGYIAWSPVPGPPKKGNTVFPLTQERKSRFLEVPNLTWRHALEPAPIDTGYRKFAQVYDVNSRAQQWWLWRGATWSYVLYLAIGIAIWRSRRWSLLALAILPLSIQIGVVADNPNQLVRYLIVPLYAGVALMPIASVPRRRVDRAAEAPRPETLPADLPDPALPTEGTAAASGDSPAG